MSKMFNLHFFDLVIEFDEESKIFFRNMALAGCIMLMILLIISSII
jgi:hypothetical protein